MNRIISARVYYSNEENYKISKEFINNLLYGSYNDKLKDVVEFYEELENNKKIVNNPIYTYELAYSWYEIVNCKKRIETSIPFLKRVIEFKYPKKNNI